MGSQVAEKPAHGRHLLQGKPGSASLAVHNLSTMLLNTGVNLCRWLHNACSGGYLCGHVSAGSKGGTIFSPDKMPQEPTGETDTQQSTTAISLKHMPHLHVHPISGLAICPGHQQLDDVTGALLRPAATHAISMLFTSACSIVKLVLARPSCMQGHYLCHQKPGNCCWPAIAIAKTRILLAQADSMW